MHPGIVKIIPVDPPYLVKHLGPLFCGIDLDLDGGQVEHILARIGLFAGLHDSQAAILREEHPAPVSGDDEAVHFGNALILPPLQSELVEGRRN